MKSNRRSILLIPVSKRVTDKKWDKCCDWWHEFRLASSPKSGTASATFYQHYKGERHAILDQDTLRPVSFFGETQGMRDWVARKIRVYRRYFQTKGYPADYSREETYLIKS